MDGSALRTLSKGDIKHGMAEALNDRNNNNADTAKALDELHLDEPTGCVEMSNLKAVGDINDNDGVAESLDERIEVKTSFECRQ